MSAADRHRVGELSPARRARFLAGRRLLSGLVDTQFPDATWELSSRDCPRCGLAHAGPEVTGVKAVASLAYAVGPTVARTDGTADRSVLVVAALAPRAVVARLGVDAERDDADHTRIADLTRLVGDGTGSMLRRWTQIEAVVKADGRGLAIDPGDVALRGDTAQIAGDPTAYQLATVPGPPDYWISVAWRPDQAAASGTARR